MTVNQLLHESKTHANGFDPNCPICVNRDGIAGIIRHLEACAKQNETDGARALAGEQRRMIGILKVYQKVNP